MALEIDNLFVVQKRRIGRTEMDDSALTSDIEGRGSRKHFVKWKFRRTINYTALRYPPPPGLVTNSLMGQ